MTPNSLIHKRSLKTAETVAAILVSVVLSGPPAASQTLIPPSAPDFAMSAAQSDAYETLAAEDALAQSHNPQVRNFAQHMIEDHARLRDRLYQSAQAAVLAPPPLAISSDQASMLAALQSLRGAEFDKAYVRQQVLAHDQALAVEQSYASSGAEPHLKAFAQDGILIIRRHLEAAQRLSSAVGAV